MWFLCWRKVFQYAQRDFVKYRSILSFTNRPGYLSRQREVTSHIYQIHYDDVIMGAMVSQITSLTIVYSTVYSGTDERKHQSSASLAFVRGIHRGTVNSPHKWPVTRKMFPFWWRHHESERNCFCVELITLGMIYLLNWIASAAWKAWHGAIFASVPTVQNNYVDKNCMMTSSNGNR